MKNRFCAPGDWANPPRQVKNTVSASLAAFGPFTLPFRYSQKTGVYSRQDWCNGEFFCQELNTGTAGN
jgi:hypothetical protein